MSTTQKDCINGSCPFAGTEQSEIAQNYGCLPTPADIIAMRQLHGKTWACHSEPSKPCAGAIRHQKERGLQCEVADSVLLTEKDLWDLYIQPGES